VGARTATSSFTAVSDTRAGDLIARSAHLYGRLPQRRFFVNTCERRGTFLIALLAALRAGATTLLPANQVSRNSGALQTCIRTRQTRHASVAAQVGRPSGPSGSLRLSGHGGDVFTSGSTGVPQGHAKSWRLSSRERRSQASACLRRRSLQSRHDRAVQHMFVSKRVSY